LALEIDVKRAVACRRHRYGFDNMATLLQVSPVLLERLFVGGTHKISPPP